MSESIYSHFENAKDGTEIPFFKSGKTMDSRYAPKQEAQRILKNLEKVFHAFLVLGCGSGTIVKEILENEKNALIICFENSKEDLHFIMSGKIFQQIVENKNVHFCTLETLYSTLTNLYLPAKYGEIKILESKPWNLENANFLQKIQSEIQHALNVIFADYSVQCHFGKIWIHNMLSNIKTLNSYKNNSDDFPSPDLSKTAAVIAAGPTLDKKIKMLKENKNRYFIIATDTAFQTLMKQNIECDVVVSIDAQNISSSHFFSAKKNKSAVFAFDFCAEKSAVKNVIKSGGKLFFFVSGHPLANFVNEKSGRKMPFVFSGSGTVTISAVSLAREMGFSKIEIFGADFSYSDGKPYTKGTYLENQFLSFANRVNPQEKYFSRLMFRTELESVSKEKKTTAVFKAYKSSLEDFLKKNSVSVILKNDIYEINFPKKNSDDVLLLKKQDFNYTAENFLKDFENAPKEIQEIILLPLVANLKNAPENSMLDFQSLIKLAHSFLLRYN